MKKQIEAKDLRIGDWVLSESGDTILIKDGLSIDACQWFAIRLTPEILNKSGFEYLPQYALWSGAICLSERIDMEGYVLTEFFKDWINIPILYLHQLQNLHYALTEKELDINLND